MNTYSPPRDHTLPQLPIALNAGIMREVFQKNLFDHSLPHSSADRYSIQDCEIERIKYKPGKNCLILYRVAICDSKSQNVIQQRLCTRIYEPGGAQARFLKAASQTNSPSRDVNSLHHIPALDMVIWTFPNERKLLTLPKIVHASYLERNILPDLIENNFGKNWLWDSYTHQIIHYVPEHTCTVKLNVQLQDKIYGYRRSLTIYGKTYYNDEGAYTHKNMADFWQRTARKQDQLLIARPLGYDKKLKTLWQQSVPGVPLQSYDLTGKPFLSLMAQAGIALAKFHTVSIKNKKRLDVYDIQQKLRRVKNDFSHCQVLSSNLTKRIQTLLQKIETVNMLPEVTLHGDVHLKNFLAHKGRVAIIDMDNICRGPAFADLGSFIATLYHRGLIENVALEKIKRAANTFLKFYQYNVYWKVDERELAFWISLALVQERVARSLTRLKKGRFEIVQQLIQLASSDNLLS